MKKPNRLRWQKLADSPPPIGVLIEVKDPAHPDTRPTVLVAMDTNWPTILPLVFMRKLVRGFQEYRICLNRETAFWRYAAGRKPSAEEIKAGATRVARQASSVESLIELKKSQEGKRVRAAAKQKEAALPAFLIRRSSSAGEGRSHYHHQAFVRARDQDEALQAARDGRVQNWRFVGQFDKSAVAYVDFEYMGESTTDERADAEAPAKPARKRTPASAASAA
jgi:hypothetical protein